MKKRRKCNQHTTAFVAIIIATYLLSCISESKKKDGVDGTWYATEWVSVSMGGISNKTYRNFDDVYHVVEINGDSIDWYTYKQYFYSYFIKTRCDVCDTLNVYLLRINGTNTGDEIKASINGTEVVFIIEKSELVFKWGTTIDGYGTDLIFRKYASKEFPKFWPDMIADTIRLN